MRGDAPGHPVDEVVDESLIADLARRHDLLVVSDEVYEHLVFEGAHIPIATLEGMRGLLEQLQSENRGLKEQNASLVDQCRSLMSDRSDRPSVE